MKLSEIHQKVMTLFLINLISRFYSFFLTSDAGQGIIRRYSATRSYNNREIFITVMVLERTTFLFILCFSVLALQFTLTSPGAGAIAQPIYPPAIMGMVATLTISTYLFFSRANLLDINFGHTIVLLKCMSIAIIWYPLYLLRVYLLPLTIDSPLDFYQISRMASLMLFLQVVPITLNGIGLKESVYAMLFWPRGASFQKGRIDRPLIFPQMFVIATIGGVISFFEEAWDPTAERICVVKGR